MATPPAPTTAADYFAGVGRSKLLGESDLARARQGWQAGGGADADVDAVRKFLVREKYLTDYQAALIQRGRADGFAVGEYVIHDRIGSGQTAGVYKAVHKSGQVVALKVLPGSKAKDANTLNRFQREGRLLTQLDHANVVRAHQLGQAGGAHYIVMEHLDGETLDAVLDKRRKLPPAEAARIAFQALQGLQHLHDRQMVHRDLKPANLMLTPPPKADTLASTVKILDIGIGRGMFRDGPASNPELLLTADGALLGTPDYLAPEQARDAHAADVRADIYSLGCVLYQMLAGRPPFQDKNVMGLMVRHATDPLPPLADVPPALFAAVEALTRKKPDDRPPTPAAAAELLRPFLPRQAQAAEKGAVLPAYRDWLESEAGSTRAAKPGTGPAPAVAVAATPVEIAKPVVAARSAAVPKPASRPDVKPVAPPMSIPLPPPAAPVAAWSPPPVVAPPAPAYMPPPPVVNVELVTLPPPRDEEDDEPEERPLTDLDRRDWLMVGGGGVLMIAAGGLGYALTRLFKPKPGASPPPPPPMEG